MRSEHRHGAHSAHHHHGKHAPRKPRSAVPWIVAAVITAALVPFAVSMLGGGSYYRDEQPGMMLTRAEQQLDKGEVDAAMDTVRLAVLRDPDATTRGQLEALSLRIQAAQARSVDREALDLAVGAATAIRDLDRQYPAASRPTPASRELARLSKSWLDRFRDVAKKHAETASLVTEVEAVWSANRAKAELERADNGADLLFSVERRLAVANPLWRETLKALDDYVATHPNDSNLGALRQRREALVPAARAAYEKHESAAQSALAAGRIDDAEQHAQAMRNAIVVDAWTPRADALDHAIRAKKK